jgi:hypothetical protein
MGGCGNGILGRGFDGLGGLGGFGGFDGGCGGCGGFGGWGGRGCGRGCGGDKRIAVITAVRAVAASGDGCFDGRW